MYKKRLSTLLITVFLLQLFVPMTAQAAINASPTSLDFGPVNIGSSKTLSVNIANNGDGSTSISASTSASGFSVVSAPSSLGPGETGTVTVRFSPTSAGSYGGSLIISNIYGSTYVNLAGAGGSSTPVISVSPGVYNFPDIAVGDISSHVLTIANTGSGTLTGTASLSGTGFSFLDSPSYSLAAGQTKTLRVQFAPTSATNYSSTITFTGGGGTTVTVTGKGFSLPKLSVSPTSLDMGRVNIGGTAVFYITVRNTGGGTLNGSCSINGTDFTGGGSYSLTAGQSASIPVRFLAVKPGYFTGTATFTGGGGTTIALNATAHSPQVTATISPTVIDFGTVNVGQSVSQSVTVQNTLDGPITVNVNSSGTFTASGSFTLGVGESRVVNVSYRPIELGTHSSSIIFITNNVGQSVLTVKGVAENNNPILTVTPNVLDFASVAVNKTKTMTFTVKNDGGGTLAGNALTGSAGFTITSGGSYSLGAGQTATVSVRFAPTSAIDYNGTVSFTGGGGAVGGLMGKGYIPAAAAAIQVTPSNLDFGSVTLNLQSELSFTVTNVGGGTLTGTASLTGAGYALTGGSYSLTSGQSKVVTVRFSPTSAVRYTATVNFTGGGGVSRSVTGLGVQEVVQPQAQIEVTPVSHSFGSIQIGNSKDLTFTVKNIGTAVLSGAASSSTSGFSVLGGAYSLSPGQSTTVTVRFAPTSAISYSGTINFSGGGGASRSVSGTGLTAPTGPIIEVTPSMINFGSVFPNNSVVRSFTVKNIGAGTLSGSATMNGAGFQLISGTSYSLTSGQERTVSVRFTPTSKISYSGTVTFTGAGGATRSVTGTGVEDTRPPAWQVYPTVIDFGDVPIGTIVKRTIRVVNLGGGTLYGSASTVGNCFWGTGTFALTNRQEYFIEVGFCPAAEDNYVGTTHVVGAGGEAVALLGRGVYTGQPPAEPQLLVTPDGTLDLGEDYLVAFPQTGHFTVSNIGGGTLSGRCTITSGAGRFTIITSPDYVLGPGESTKITIRGLPASAGFYNGTASFTGGGGATRPLTMYARDYPYPEEEPILQTIPGLLDFGPVEVGQQKQMTFILRNYGPYGTSTDVRIRQTSPHFFVTEQVQRVGFVTVTVTYKPQSLGSHSSRVNCDPVRWTTVGYDDWEDDWIYDWVPNYYIDSVGVNIQGNGIGYGPELLVEPASLDFAEVPTNRAKELTVRVTNAGIGTLTGSAVLQNVAPDASFTVIDGSYSLTAGQSKNITVRFTPAAVADYTGRIRFSGGSSGYVYVGISGAGTEPAPKLVVTPEALDFGEMAAGDRKTMQFTVTNEGTLPLTGKAILTSGNEVFDVQLPHDRGKLRVVTITSESMWGTWRAYDADVNTGVKQSNANFTDFSAFSGTNYRSDSQLSHIYSAMTYIGNNTIRVITITDESMWGTWKAYDVDLTTGAKTLVTTFTDFSAFSGTNYRSNSRYSYIGSAVAYIGNNTLRVITITDESMWGTWKAYDVDLTTGAKTLVTTFTDFSAFSGTNYRSDSQLSFIGSTMTYIGNNTLRVVTITDESMWGTWRTYDVDLTTGAKTLVTTFTDFSAFSGTNYRSNSRYSFMGSTIAYIPPAEGEFTLEPGKSMPVYVTCSPSDTNRHYGSVTFLSDGGNAIGNLFVGHGAPDISVTPAVLNYGDISLGETPTLDFTVTNIGTQTLIGSVSSSNPIFRLLKTDFHLPAGGSVTIPVQAVATTGGSQWGNIVFATNAETSPTLTRVVQLNAKKSIKVILVE